MSSTLPGARGASSKVPLEAREISRLSRSNQFPYGRWFVAVVLLAFAASLLVSVASNDNIAWDIVAQYFTASNVLKGLWMTVVMSVIAMVLGTLLGGFLAVAKLSNNVVLTTVSNVFIWFFRGVPLLVQMLLWGNLALLFPTLSIGLPFTDIKVLEVSTNSVVSVFVAGTLALALHEAAYMAEIIRGGVNAVGLGQREACIALGMTDSLGMRRILLPQATRIIIPPTGNQFISLIKASSMVSVIAGGDLVTEVQNIASINYRVVELLLVASGWYLVIVSVLTVGQYFLERRFARGTRR